MKSDKKSKPLECSGMLTSYEDILPKIEKGTNYSYIRANYIKLEYVVKDGVWKDYDCDIRRLAMGNFFLDRRKAEDYCNMLNSRINMISHYIKK